MKTTVGRGIDIDYRDSVAPVTEIVEPVLINVAKFVVSGFELAKSW